MFASKSNTVRFCSLLVWLALFFSFMQTIFGNVTLYSQTGSELIPRLGSVAPNCGPTYGESLVIIRGRNFNAFHPSGSNLVVTFGHVHATEVTVLSQVMLSCKTPAHAKGVVDVIVSNNNGSGTKENGFTYIDPPEILEIDPPQGSANGGAKVTITCTGLTTSLDTKVLFGEIEANRISVKKNVETILCQVPPHAPGAVDVTVINSGGKHTLPNGFLYEGTPTIVWLEYTKTAQGDLLTLTWGLSSPGDEIKVYRGTQLIGELSGNASEFSYNEEIFGHFRYTVALFMDGLKVDQKSVLVDFGKVTWDPPSSGGTLSGYYLYVVEAVGDPYEQLPYNNPENYDFDTCGPFTEVQLLDLHDLNLITDGKYYLAASSYEIHYPNTLISVLTDPITFQYEVVIDEP